jgi:hypothetical protein
MLSFLLGHVTDRSPHRNIKMEGLVQTILAYILENSSVLMILIQLGFSEQRLQSISKRKVY